MKGELGELLDDYTRAVIAGIEQGARERSQALLYGYKGPPRPADLDAVPLSLVLARTWEPVRRADG